jgi:hypothetical protein
MISIDEQIADEIDSFELHRQIHCRVDPMMAAKIASLQRLKAIDAVQVPEEPKYVEAMRSLGKTDPAGYGDLVDYIDTLRNLLKRESARASEWEAEAGNQFQYAGRVLEQANAAEAKLSAMLKLGEEPSEEMRDAGNEVILNRANTLRAWRLMFAKLIEQAEGK